MAVSISPVFNGLQAFDNLGNPLAGGKLYTYAGGGGFSTLQDTFTDDSGDTANSNPIILDSSGRLNTDIWLTNGQAYDFLLADSTDVTLETVSGVVGVVASTPSGGSVTEVWIPSTNAPTYLSGTSFVLPSQANPSSTFTSGSRVKLTITGGDVYGTITSASTLGSNTTVVFQPDSGTINASLSVASYSTSRPLQGFSDAGAVSYVSALSYATSGTVGNKLKSLDTDIATLTAYDVGSKKVWPTSGSAGTFTATASPAFTAYTTDSVFTVKFNGAATTSTLNVNGLGAKSLKAYTSAGALADPIITANMVSDIGYDVGNDVLVVLDALPAAAAAATPRGEVVFVSNGTATVPAGVYYIRVTCVGGGGGGGAGFEGYVFDDFVAYPGGTGGTGGTAVKTISTTPGATYAVSVGIGGATGSAGGNSSFGTTEVIATGGAAGAAGTSGGAGANGANGTVSAGSFGTSGTAWLIGSTLKGVGGASSTGGSAGLVIMEY